MVEEKIKELIESNPILQKVHFGKRKFGKEKFDRISSYYDPSRRNKRSLFH